MSQPKWGRTFGLLAVLLVMGALMTWYDSTILPKREAKEDAAKKFLPLKDVQIASFKLLNGDHSFEFQCVDIDKKLCKISDASRWELTEPMKLKGDSQNIQALLSSLNNIFTTEKFDLSTDAPEKRSELLKGYGLTREDLARPSIRKIVIKDDQGNTTTAFLGNTHPINEAIFSLVSKSPANQENAPDENQVLLVPGFTKAHLDHDLTYWRDKKIFSLSPSEIQAFQFQGPQGTLSAEKTDGKWNVQFGTSEPVPGDFENIDNFITAVLFLNAKSFPLAQDASGAKTWLTVTLKKDSKETAPPLVAAFLKKGDRHFIKVSGLDPLFEIDASLKDRLDKNPKDFRVGKLLTTMERFSAKSMDFSGVPYEGKPLHFEIGDPHWGEVQGLLDRLSSNRIKEILEGTKIPAGEDQGIKLSLVGEKPELSRNLVFWKVSDKTYARDLSSKRKEAFLLDPLTRDALPWTSSGFVKPTEPVGIKTK